MEINIITAVSRLLSITPVEPVRSHEREERKKKYASKKKPGKLFSNVLLNEISSIKAPVTKPKNLSLTTLSLLVRRYH
jgi:hypothetical protein